MFNFGYIIALCAFILIIVQAVQLVYLPGSSSNPEATNKYKNLTICDIVIPTIMSSNIIITSILIIFMALMSGSKIFITICAVILIVMQSVGLVYIPGAAANPNADKYKTLTGSDTGISAGMGACSIIILVIILGMSRIPIG